MRKNKIVNQQNEFSILTVDDDRLMTETVQSYFQAAGYQVDIENDPEQAVERVRAKKYDILLLDFLMRPICGDEVVRRIRTFNQDICIVLLTGHKSMAPPIKTIRELDIQGYYEKNDRFDQLELLIESCTKSIRQMRTIRSYRDGLQGILDKVAGLNNCQTVDAILPCILEQIGEILPSTGSFVYCDFGQQDVPSISFLGSGVFWAAEQLARGYFQQLGGDNYELTVLADEQLLLAPLYAERGQVFGLLAARSVGAISDESLQLLQVYAKQVSSILGNLQLRQLLQQTNHELSVSYAALRQNHEQMVDTMRKMVDAKDCYTRGHSDRVAFYAVQLARAMGKDEAYVNQVKTAGLFHDLGKIGIPDSILQKRGTLDAAEYEQIKQHAAQGAQILTSVTSLHDILPIIAAHHEHYDGKGYPAGLSGTAIPEQARIISVVDAFDAMTSKRVYRDSLTLDQARAELERGKNTQFDGELVEVFLGLLEQPEKLQQQLIEELGDAVIFKKVGEQ